MPKLELVLILTGHMLPQKILKIVFATATSAASCRPTIMLMAVMPSLEIVLAPATNAASCPPAVLVS